MTYSWFDEITILLAGQGKNDNSFLIILGIMLCIVLFIFLVPIIQSLISLLTKNTSSKKLSTFRNAVSNNRMQTIVGIVGTAIILLIALLMPNIAKNLVYSSMYSGIAWGFAILIVIGIVQIVFSILYAQKLKAILANMSN